MGFSTEPNGNRPVAPALEGDAGGEENLFLLHHVLLELVRELVEDLLDAEELGVGVAVNACDLVDELAKRR